MNRLMIAGAIAAAACAISIPAATAMTTDGPSGGSGGPSHSQLVDDRNGANRGSDDVASATPTSITMEPGDDNGVHAEPGDDNGTAVEPGDDNGVHAEPADDKGAHVQLGDDHGRR